MIATGPSLPSSDPPFRKLRILANGDAHQRRALAYFHHFANAGAFVGINAAQLATKRSWTLPSMDTHEYFQRLAAAMNGS
jgi:hypothetical protein